MTVSFHLSKPWLDFEDCTGWKGLAQGRADRKRRMYLPEAGSRKRLEQQLINGT